MIENRSLKWDGCNNVRDLGGLRTGDGRLTRPKAVVRSDTPARLSEKGWAALNNYGIRTIITLHTNGLVEEELDFRSPYPDIVTIQAEIEDLTDREFVEQWVLTDLWGTPLYHQDTLQRWPEKHAAVISAVGQAPPGGVLFHCVRGYDRTGIISVLLLGLVGVLPKEISEDYELSHDTYRDEMLNALDTTSGEVIRETMANIDLETYLLGEGVSQEDLEAVRTRFLEPADENNETGSSNSAA